MLHEDPAGEGTIGWTDDSGATAVEYGLFVALIAAVVITAVGVLGTGLVGALSLTWP